MLNTKIFDKDGNELSLPKVIVDYILQKSLELDSDPEDLVLGMNSTSYVGGSTYLELYRLEDNGYDATDVQNIESIKI